MAQIQAFEGFISYPSPDKCELGVSMNFVLSRFVIFFWKFRIMDCLKRLSIQQWWFSSFLPCLQNSLLSKKGFQKYVHITFCILKIKSLYHFNSVWFVFLPNFQFSSEKGTAQQHRNLPRLNFSQKSLSHVTSSWHQKSNSPILQFSNSRI